MIKKLVLLIVFLCIGLTFVNAATLLHSEKVATISMAQFDSIRHSLHVPPRLAPARFGVDVYDVDYATTWWDGSPIKASGLILIPRTNGKAMALIAYGHGTRLQRERIWKMSGEEAVCAFFAADGYAVAMPDYIGLGRGEKKHLYHHAETEATCMVDALRAMKELNQQLGTADNGQLFITGYSQGGHVAMATHRYLQMHPELGMKVTASAPMSGAYDLAGVQSEVLGNVYGNPGYLPYLLYSYQEVYRFLPEHSTFLRPPYDSLIPPLFDGMHKLREVNAIMPAIPAEAMDPALLSMYKQDPTNALSLAMQENTLIHWAPEAPMLLCYCKADEQVIYRNSLVARDSLEARGSKVVHMRHVSRRFGHGTCALFASMYVKMWFDSFRDGSIAGKRGPAWNRFLISISKGLFKKPKKPKKQPSK